MKNQKNAVLPLLVALLFVCGCSARTGLAAASYLRGSRSVIDTGYGDVLFASASLAGDFYHEYPASSRFVQTDDMRTWAQTVSLQTSFNAAEEAETLLTTLTQRKLVRSADFRIRVENLEKADSSINALMEQYGAYSSFTNIMENNRWYTIRVPSVFYDSFLAAINGMGRILHRSENTEDVTLRYFDLDGRLTTKQELLGTFRSYLGRANNIEEILSVEARIAQLQNELEGTGRELRMLANLIDYSTVTISLEGPLASEPFRGLTLSERIGRLFGGFQAFLSAATVFLIGLVIYGIPILLILVLLFWLFFGRLGLVKRLYRVAAEKKTCCEKSEHGEP